MGRKTVDGGFDPGMDAELAILASHRKPLH